MTAGPGSTNAITASITTPPPTPRAAVMPAVQKAKAMRIPLSTGDSPPIAKRLASSMVFA
jgi:hypothetical protein